jgi:hypothetical protein
MSMWLAILLPTCCSMTIVMELSVRIAFPPDLLITKMATSWVGVGRPAHNSFSLFELPLTWCVIPKPVSTDAREC